VREYKKLKKDLSYSLTSCTAFLTAPLQYTQLTI